MPNSNTTGAKITIRMALAVLLFSSAALADRETSHQFFDEGTQHYNVGRFDAAAASYEKAYEAEPIPALLFNVAQAHQEAGTLERALFFYEAYLRESPEAPNRPLVLERIGEAQRALELQQAKEKQKAQSEQIEAEKQRARIAAEARHDELKRAEQQRAEAEARAREARARADQSEAEAAPLTEQAWFWPAIGVVGVVSAVTLTAALTAGGTTAGVMALRTRDTMGPINQSE